MNLTAQNYKELAEAFMDRCGKAESELEGYRERERLATQRWYQRTKP